MSEVTFNGVNQHIESVEQLGVALDGFDRAEQFELWCSVTEGPSLRMLRSGGNSWLMYLRFPGDSGFHSIGETRREGTAAFLLRNGQVEEHPLAWCVDVEQCYKAVAFFFVNAGQRPSWIDWCAD